MHNCLVMTGTWLAYFSIQLGIIIPIGSYFSEGYTTNQISFLLAKDPFGCPAGASQHQRPCSRGTNRRVLWVCTDGLSKYSAPQPSQCSFCSSCSTCDELMNMIWKQTPQASSSCVNLICLNVPEYICIYMHRYIQTSARWHEDVVYSGFISLESVSKSLPWSLHTLTRLMMGVHFM